MPPGYAAPPVYAVPTTPTLPMPATSTTSVRALWIPGLVGLPIAWVATWMNANIAFRTGADGVNLAYVPLVGPWLVLAAGNAETAYYVATGIFQDVSFLCFVLGLIIRVPEPRARFALGPSLPALEVAAVPTSTGGSMSASLQF